MLCEKTSATVCKLRHEHDKAAARHHELHASIRGVVKACEERENKTADTPVRLRKVYDHGRRVMVEGHVGEWSAFREQMASLKNCFETENLELQTMPGLLAEAARVWQNFFEARKELGKRGVKLASLKEVRDEIPVTKKEVAKLETFLTRPPKHRLFIDNLTRKR